MRITSWYRPLEDIAVWEGTILVIQDARFVPIAIRELEARKARSFYSSQEEHATGLDTICKQQEALLMDVYTGLVREIRAMRGVDELQPGYDDPQVDPFSLSMGHIEKLAMAQEATNAKLDEILVKLQEGAQSPEELAQIVQQLGTIAAALA